MAAVQGTQFQCAVNHIYLLLINTLATFFSDVLVWKSYFRGSSHAVFFFSQTCDKIYKKRINILPLVKLMFLLIIFYKSKEMALELKKIKTTGMIWVKTENDLKRMFTLRLSTEWIYIVIMSFSKYVHILWSHAQNHLNLV